MEEQLKNFVINYSNDGCILRNNFFKTNLDKIIESAKLITERITNGNFIYFCGNGGSAADAQHIAAELVNKFSTQRMALPGHALTTDTSILTAIGNDISFDSIFSRQIEAYGKDRDILFAISTSGNSKNIIEAINTAKNKNMYTISVSGNDGGIISKISHQAFVVDSDKTPLIQEVHIALEHMLCYLIDLYIPSFNMK